MIPITNDEYLDGNGHSYVQTLEQQLMTSYEENTNKTEQLLDLRRQLQNMQEIDRCNAEKLRAHRKVLRLVMRAFTMLKKDNKALEKINEQLRQSIEIQNEKLVERDF